jgi:6-phosphogluconolactonase
MGNIQKNVQQEWMIYTGSYAEENSAGIHLFKLNLKEKKLDLIEKYTGIENPSYLVINKDQTHLYAVSEVEYGMVVSYGINRQTDQLRELNRKATNGMAPCYVSLNESNNCLYISNYGGTVTKIAIQEDGSLGEHTTTNEHIGSGVWADRQDAAHAHSIVPVPDSSVVVAADLGTDKLYLYDANDFTNIGEMSTIPGSGPRHFAFHPNMPIMYVIQELSNTIAVFELNEHHVPASLLGVITTLPNDYKEENTAADLHITSDGQFLYASNRGHDSIVTYKVSESGMPEIIAFTPTEGKGPRNFTLIDEENVIIVANEQTDSLVLFEINKDGIPTYTGTSVPLPKPVCVQAIARKNE